METEKSQQRNALTNLPNKPASSNVKLALDDKMILSDAIDAAGRLIDQFPNAKGYTNGFIGALAQVLGQYPKQVVNKCIDARSGLSRDIKFLSICDVVAWLERGERPLHERADREVRVKRQVEETDAWRNLKVPESLKAKGRAWLDRTDPVAQQLSGQMPKVVTEEQKAAYLASARATGKSIAGMSLRPETLATLQKWQLMPTAREIPAPSFNEPPATAASVQAHQGTSASDDVDFGSG